jgi:hypothetical protein
MGFLLPCAMHAINNLRAVYMRVVYPPPQNLPRAMHAINLRAVYMRVVYPPPQNLPRAMHAINLSCAAFGAVCVCVCMCIHACVREWKGRYVNLCVVPECACVCVCICVHVLHTTLSLRQRWVDVWTRV